MSCDPFLDGCVARTPPAGACTRAADLTQAVVTAGMAAVDAFICPTAPCGGIAGYVSHGEPSIDFDNVVVAWVTELGSRMRTGNQIGCAVFSRVTIRTQLWLGAWPIGVEGQPPPTALKAEASRLSTIIAESWYGGTLAGLAAAYPDMCKTWTLGVMRPRGPEGNSVGWEFDLTANLDGSCA